MTIEELKEDLLSFYYLISGQLQALKKILDKLK